MRFSKVLFIGFVTVFVTLGVLFTNGVQAASSTQEFTDALPKVFCLKWDNYSDVMNLYVTDLGMGHYSIAGHVPVYDPNSISGTGRLSGGHFYAVVQGARPNDNRYMTYAIDVTISTMTGTADTTFYYGDYTGVTVLVDQPVSIIPCPPVGAPDAGPKADPFAK